MLLKKSNKNQGKEYQVHLHSLLPLFPLPSSEVAAWDVPFHTCSTHMWYLYIYSRLLGFLNSSEISLLFFYNGLVLL